MAYSCRPTMWNFSSIWILENIQHWLLESVNLPQDSFRTSCWPGAIPSSSLPVNMCCEMVLNYSTNEVPINSLVKIIRILTLLRGLPGSHRERNAYCLESWIARSSTTAAICRRTHNCGRFSKMLTTLSAKTQQTSESFSSQAVDFRHRLVEPQPTASRNSADAKSCL